MNHRTSGKPVKEQCFFCSLGMTPSQKALVLVDGKHILSHIDCAYRAGDDFRTHDGFSRSHITLITYQPGRTHYSAQMAITYMRRSKGKYVVTSK